MTSIAKENKINVFAHIAGPSGAGKTWFINKLRSKYIVRDIDEFILNMPSISSLDAYKESLAEWVTLRTRFDPNPIVLVGFNYYTSQLTGELEIIPINAEWRFVIDISIDDIIKNINEREGVSLSDIDIQSIKKSTDEAFKLYNAMGYIKDTQEGIFGRMVRIYTLFDRPSFDYYPSLYPQQGQLQDVPSSDLGGRRPDSASDPPQL